MQRSRQHYVPSSYLKAWCEPETPTGQTPYVWIIAKDRSSTNKRAPDNIFKERELYTIRLPDGSRDLTLEEGLAGLEKDFCRIRREVISHGFDYAGYFSTSAAERVEALAAAANHVLSLDDGKKRFLDVMVALNQTSGIAIHLERARHLRDEVGLFQAIQKNLSKYTTGSGQGSRKRGDELGLTEATWRSTMRW
jgi:hypothetical protein